MAYEEPAREMTKDEMAHTHLADMRGELLERRAEALREAQSLERRHADAVKALSLMDPIIAALDATLGEMRQPVASAAEKAPFDQSLAYAPVPDPLTPAR
jgi:hypothetical protein